ncbi:DnaD domain-containing protein [Tumebacillus permanentifrigoris]|uniref:DnaD domain-containing protein n=1 Tax=Tumebacillus permanentifrigoris TaxID=378543 RepID=UPI001FEBF8D4|nr:DnaD domain protein [Tumebacillus permanentifrigoris]
MSDGDVYNAFEKEFGRPLSPMEFEEIRDYWLPVYPRELIVRALREAVLNQARHMKYVNNILVAWWDKKWTTPEAVEAGKAQEHLKRTDRPYQQQRERAKVLQMPGAQTYSTGAHSKFERNLK